MPDADTTCPPPHSTLGTSTGVPSRHVNHSPSPNTQACTIWVSITRRSSGASRALLIVPLINKKHKRGKNLSGIWTALQGLASIVRVCQIVNFTCSVIFFLLATCFKEEFSILCYMFPIYFLLQISSLFSNLVLVISNLVLAIYLLMLPLTQFNTEVWQSNVLMHPPWFLKLPTCPFLDTLLY